MRHFRDGLRQGDTEAQEEAGREEEDREEEVEQGRAEDKR